MLLNRIIYLFLFGSLLISQAFDPNTGEMIKADSLGLKLKFDPETGEIINHNKANTVKFKNSYQSQNRSNILNDWEIKQIARQDAFQNFKGEKLTYKFMGGTVALISIPPTIGLSMVLGEIILDDPGIGLGFLVGSAIGTFINPKILANIDSKPQQIFLLQNNIKDLNNNQKKLYSNHYSKSLKAMRTKEIYQGELLTIGGSLALIIILTTMP